MIKYVKLGVTTNEYENTIEPLIKKIFLDGQFISDSYVEEFENKFKTYCKTKYAIAVNSGTDALIFALKSLGIKKGDEVITVSNSFIATANAISYLGAKPIFVDINDNLLMNVNKIEEAITSKTKAIIPVHLMGLVCEMNKINKLAKKYGLFVIEDAAQSIGSTYKNQRTGSLSTIGCFSLHPLKNLAGVTDGGIVTTNNKKIASYIKQIRNHGLINRDTQNIVGRVSRLNSINAVILSYRLSLVNNIIKDRRKNAEIYNKLLQDIPHIKLIQVSKDVFHTYHTYIIKVKKRDLLQEYLLKHDIETKIHYPISIHKQKPFKKTNHLLRKTNKYSKQILTLPISNVSEEEITYVAKTISNFYKDL